MFKNMVASLYLIAKDFGTFLLYIGSLDFASFGHVIPVVIT